MSDNKENENQENEITEENNEVTEQTPIEENNTVIPAQSNPSEMNNSEASGAKNGLSWVLGSLLLVAVIVIISMLVSNDKTAADSGVVATVNGENITSDKLFQIAPDEMKTQLIDQVVMQTLIEQKAAEENITITEEDINEAVDKQMAKYDEMFPTQEEFDAALAQAGLTKEALVQDLKDNMQTELKMKKILEPQIDVSDESIATFYEENKEQINQSIQVQASHILVEDEQLANSLLEQIQGGADFAELATEHSIDPGSKVKGGDLGFFGRGQMVPEFEEAAFNLKVGEVSEVVQTQHGYHIIKLADKEEPLTLEDDKEEIKEMLFNQEFNKLAQEWVKTIKDEADIKIL
jgi:foldase protein PrsA